MVLNVRNRERTQSVLNVFRKASVPGSDRLKAYWFMMKRRHIVTRRAAAAEFYHRRKGKKKEKMMYCF